MLSAANSRLCFMGFGTIRNAKSLEQRCSIFENQEIPQSQTANKPMVPRGRATQQSQDTRKTNYAKQPALSSPSR